MPGVSWKEFFPTLRSSPPQAEKKAALFFAFYIRHEASRTINVPSLTTGYLRVCEIAVDGK